MTDNYPNLGLFDPWCEPPKESEARDTDPSAAPPVNASKELMLEGAGGGFRVRGTNDPATAIIWIARDLRKAAEHVNPEDYDISLDPLPDDVPHIRIHDFYVVVPVVDESYNISHYAIGRLAAFFREVKRRQHDLDFVTPFRG